MAKKKQDAEPEGGENYPTHLEQGESPDTEQRLHGEQDQPVGHTIDGTEPDEAQLPIEQPATVRIALVGGDQKELRPKLQRMVDDLQKKGIDAELVEVVDAPAAEGSDGSVAQVRAFHNGVEQTLFRLAHDIDGTMYVGNKGTLLAEALELNNTELNAKMKGLGA